MSPPQLISYIETEILLGSHPEPLTPDTELVLSGVLDSIALMRLVSHIEKSQGLKIPDDGLVIGNFSTPTAVCRYVDSLR